MNVYDQTGRDWSLRGRRSGREAVARFYSDRGKYVARLLLASIPCITLHQFRARVGTTRRSGLIIRRSWVRVPPAPPWWTGQQTPLTCEGVGQGCLHVSSGCAVASGFGRVYAAGCAQYVPKIRSCRSVAARRALGDVSAALESNDQKCSRIRRRPLLVGVIADERGQDFHRGGGLFGSLGRCVPARGYRRGARQSCRSRAARLLADSFNVSVRCGFRPRADQIRCTVALDTPTRAQHVECFKPGVVECFKPGVDVPAGQRFPTRADRPGARDRWRPVSR